MSRVFCGHRNVAGTMPKLYVEIIQRAASLSKMGYSVEFKYSESDRLQVTLSKCYTEIKALVTVEMAEDVPVDNHRYFAIDFLRDMVNMHVRDVLERDAR